MVKYALSMMLILLLGTCGDRGAGPKTGRIALDVQDPASPDEASGTVVQRVDRMVATVLQNETVVMSEDLRYEGGVWLGELTVSTGSYSVVVEAYKEAIVKWRGSALVLVQGGESNRVVIALTSTNQVPVLADIGDQTIAEGRTLTILLVGSDVDGDALTYAAEGAPEGSSLSGSTFTWEPSHTQAGEYSVTFTVADEHGGVAREIIIITVDETNQAPTLAAIGDQTVVEGSLLTITLDGTDVDGDALTYEVVDNPPGSSLSGATFRWQPSDTEEGMYQVTFRVEDEHGGQAVETIVITVQSRLRRLTNHSEGDEAPSWSPDGTQIAFQSYRDGDWNIYVMDADGSNLRQLTRRRFVVWNPSWSPDGTQIAFQSRRDENTEIYVMDADGSNSRRLTNHNAEDGSPSWSPDGTQIAFQSRRDGNDEIYVMDADGSNLRRLTSHSGTDRYPSWSPDGTQIAFQSYRDGDWNIYVLYLPWE